MRSWSVPLVLTLLIPLGASAIEQPLFGELQVNAIATYDQIRPHMDTDAAGRFLVMWEDCLGPCSSFRHLRARLYDRLRTPLTGNIEVTSGFTARARVAPRPDGWVTAWVRLPGALATYEDILGQRLDSAGNLVGGPIPMSTDVTTYKNAPGLATNASGAFVVVWESYTQDGSGYGIFGRRFDSAGNPQGGEFPVNAYTTGGQRAARVASAPDGSFLVVWSGEGATDSSGIFARRFDGSGNPQGGDIQVNAYTTGTQASPDVDVDASGSYVVVWSGATIQGDSEGIAVREVDATGTPLSAFESQANLTSAGAQNEAAVSMEPFGNYIVAWSSDGQDGSGKAVYELRYNRFLHKGTEYRVNTYTAGDQWNPTVTAAYAGGFVVAWTSVDQDDPMSGVGDGGIFLQAFTDPNLISGNKLRIKDNPDPTKRNIRLVAKAFNVTTRPIEGGPDPVANGAFLHVYNGMGGGDSACIPLPASGWTTDGDTFEPTFRYRDSTFANGPCKKVLLKHGKLVATCQAKLQPISYSLDEPTQGSVVTRLRSAGYDVCAVFGGTVAESSHVFLATNAPFATDCTDPPAPCP